MPIALDPDEAELLQLARLKMSSQDQEAMRRLRSTMIMGMGEGSGSIPFVVPLEQGLAPGLSNGEASSRRRVSRVDLDGPQVSLCVSCDAEPIGAHTSRL